MKLTEFQKISGRFWDAHLSTAQEAMRSGTITLGTRVPSFPQSLLVTSCPGHFVMELIGGRTSHNKPLKLIKHELDSLDLYLGQFPELAASVAMMTLDGQDQGITHLALIAPQTVPELERRFPRVLSLFGSQLQFISPDPATTLRIGPHGDRIVLERVLLGNASNSTVRIRSVQLAVIVRRDMSTTDYKAFLEAKFADQDVVHGVPAWPSQQVEVINRAAQFANVYLLNKLHETSIGTFIVQHREIILDALNATDLLPQP